MTPPLLLPTHHCFDDALEYLHARVRSGADFDTLTLVHAILVAPDGNHYTHAWVEESGIVIDAGLLDGERVYYRADRVAYYGARTIETILRYTPHDAYAQIRSSGSSRAVGSRAPDAV